jgi:SAM-dependent methyltransferase
MCGGGPETQSFFGRRLDRRQGLWPGRIPGLATSIYRCRTCGLLYPNPMPVPQLLEQHYDVAPEQYWTDSYFHVEPDYMRSQIDTFVRLYGREPHGCSALDVGAGIGKAMVAFDHAGFDTFGIEPSPAFRAAAIERMGVAPERLQLASVESARVPAASFDFINLAVVLEHVPDPAAALGRCMEWLKPGGLMHVEVPSSAFLLSRLVRLFYRLTLNGDYVINLSPMHSPYHLYEFSLQSFVLGGARAGYDVVHHEYYPCAAYLPARLVRLVDALMKWSRTGMQLVVWLRRSAT